MKTTILNDQWTLTVLGENVYNIPGTPIRTEVPSTVYSTLLGGVRRILHDFGGDIELPDAVHVVGCSQMFEVPSTVYSTLLGQDLIPDPFYRDNELTALKLMENDCYCSIFGGSVVRKISDKIE